MVKFRTSKKIFIHIDCDSFFAECEILKNPQLKNEYVLVGREIVVACNYKTKALWITTGMPVWKAEEILKGRWIFLEGDHSFYSLVSRKMMKYLKENTLSIEPFSIDEAFCEITGLPELYKLNLEDYILKLQKDVVEYIWVPVSIWVSTTRIKAKIFSKLNKPLGVFIDISNSRETFEELPLDIVPFIGKSMQNKLKYSCENVYDFVNLWYWDLKKNIWKSATDLWLELSWVNAFRVKKSPHSKSMSRGRSFNKNITSNKEFLYSQFLLNFNHLYEEFSLRNYKLKKVSIFFRDKDKVITIFHYNLAEYSTSRKDILEIVQRLFQKYYSPDNLIRSTWVVFWSLEKITFQQLNIFQKVRKVEQENSQLIWVINKLNQKYSSHKVAFGTDLLGKDFESKWGIRV